MKKSARINLIIIILFFLVIILGGVSLYLYFRSVKVLNKEDANKKEIQTLVDKVGDIVFLPSDETPTVATISDPKVLKDQVFFANAKTGDKVLIYTNNKKAFLYDPKADKLVNMAPFNVNSNDKKIE